MIIDLNKKEGFFTKMEKKFRKFIGFTLIELMIVVSILSIIVVIALPLLEMMVIRSKTVIQKQNGQVIAQYQDVSWLHYNEAGTVVIFTDKSGAQHMLSVNDVEVISR